MPSSAESPTGECACPQRGGVEMILCRDPSVPAPPRTICPLCRRPRHRIILDGRGFRDREPPYEPVPSLREFYIKYPAEPPAYEPADANTIRRLAGLDAYEPGGTP